MKKPRPKSSTSPKRVPKAVYCAVALNGQVIGHNTNRAELVDYANTYFSANSFKIFRYVLA